MAVCICSKLQAVHHVLLDWFRQATTLLLPPRYKMPVEMAKNPLFLDGKSISFKKYSLITISPNDQWFSKLNTDKFVY